MKEMPVLIFRAIHKTINLASKFFSNPIFFVNSTKKT
jgi:hypothetical protein